MAGSRGGRRIAAPPGRDTRPTADRVREALFSALQSRRALFGRRFLDLYAGSGAVGLEAASRGASAVLLIESDARAARTARANVAALDLAGVCQVAAGRVGSVLAAGATEPFDVVFADPPYATGEEEISAMLAALVDGGWLAAEAVVVVERSSRSPQPVWPAAITGERGRRYGETQLWYGRRA